MQSGSTLLSLAWSYLLLLVPPVLTEEPFCGNKCNGGGVTTSSPCYCDRGCATLFNDCCGDSEYLSVAFSRLPEKRSLMSCMNIGRSNVLVVDRCPEKWNGPDSIRSSCQATNRSTNDPMSWIPVTSSSTGLTYSNYHCAICNGEVQKTVFWRVNVACPTLHSNFLLDSDDIFVYIYYNQENREWGFTTLDDKGNEVFHGCGLEPNLSKQLMPMVRSCDPKEVDTCSPNWKKDVIRQMCGRYSDPVFSNGTRYKNLYCAICNQEDQSGLTCGSAMGPRHDVLPSTAAEGPNFALLLDINFSENNSVGKKKLSTDCEKDEVYDPFKKQCRNIVCGIPGYTLVNGRCTKVNER